METIIRAAISQDGSIYVAYKGGRHRDVISYMEKTGVKPKLSLTKGFMTSDRRFVGRKEAATIARAAGQIGKVKLTNPQSELYSEDLW